MNTKHAVVTGTHIMWIEGKGFHREVVLPSCDTLCALADIAYPHFITHLWVPPFYGEFEQVKSAVGWNFSCYENRRGQMMGANVRKVGHQKKDLEIIFPQHTAWWGTDQNHGWMRDADPYELLITIHYLEQVLGVPVGSSPGRTGWNYLKSIHPEWIEEITGVDLKACHFDRSISTDIIWDRPLLPDELEKKFLHKFDKGGAYPYAGTQTDVGVGTPVHVDHGHDAVHEKGHPQEVGVWRCSIKYNSAVYDANMPPIWKENQTNYKATEGWLAGPIIRLLRSMGHEVTIHEGWVFPARRDVLVKWGNDLFAKRQDFDTPGKWRNARCAQFAKRGTKQIANSMIGMTAFRDFDDDDEMKRPDIRQQVIARHRELTWHNINKIKEMCGVTPVLVYMDAAYYLSDEPDGRKAFPEMVKREGKIGGWKWEGRISMEGAAQCVLTAKLNEAGKLEELNKYGWVQS